MKGLAQLIDDIWKDAAEKLLEGSDRRRKSYATRILINAIYQIRNRQAEFARSDMSNSELLAKLNGMDEAIKVIEAYIEDIRRAE